MHTAGTYPGSALELKHGTFGHFTVTKAEMPVVVTSAAPNDHLLEKPLNRSNTCQEVESSEEGNIYVR